MPRLASVKSETVREPGLLRTPPVSSREQSISSAPPPQTMSSSNKRSAGQIVDLTISSDEDDEPPRAAKIQRSSNNFPRGVENMPLRPNGAPRQHLPHPLGTPSHQPRDYGSNLR